MKLFQIYYDEASSRSLDPDFIPLDNRNSERADWFEYWPIRQTLLKQAFKDEEYVGFFSPRFKEKTGLSGAEVIARMGSATQEVVSFSPSLHEGALFLNSFYQAEALHPGCLSQSQEFLDTAKIDIKLHFLVQDQSRIIFSNYFVAKYRFWKKWQDLTNQLFEICERRDGPLSQRLNAITRHRGKTGYQMKIFIMERMVSIALELENLNAEIGKDPILETKYGTGPVLRKLLALDALKTQYIKTGNKSFIGQYMKMQKELIASVSQRGKSPA
ncbi:hypothetical protein [Ottowia caeni]|uniref:hypothetical protein n=1 Tax=Ottowia caeni TaxID=2870339 RepID=UPI001E31EB42|nr:hypothetical protein [Ottowia caeni]